MFTAGISSSRHGMNMEFVPAIPLLKWLWLMTSSTNPCKQFTEQKPISADVSKR